MLSALWDIKAKRAGLPLWKLMASMSPEELVAVVDFSHIRDALTEAEALEMLRAGQEGKAERIAELEAHGFPGYTTAPGWLGYSDEKMQRLAREAVAEGFTLIKMKVAGNVEDDKRRMRLVREAVGPDIRIAVDANQRWEVDEAGPWINQLQEFNLWWVEEPTSPDDILGHARIRKEIAPIRVATGEAVQNRIVFKQLLQAGAIDVMQIDSTRVAGPGENIANLLLAAKFGVPVCPHAGGVGLCELVQHYSFFDYAVVARTKEDRVIEYVDHLHEHFVSPVKLTAGHYEAPSRAGDRRGDAAGVGGEVDLPGWRRLERPAGVGSGQVARPSGAAVSLRGCPKSRSAATSDQLMIGSRMPLVADLLDFGASDGGGRELPVDPLDDPHDLERVEWIDRQRAIAPDGGGDTGIEGRVVAALGGHDRVAEFVGHLAEGIRCADSVGVVGGQHAGVQRRLLGVQPVHAIGARGAEHPEPGPGQRRDAAHRQVRPHAAFVEQ